MFGKLSWEAVPFHEPIVMVTIAMIALGGLALFAGITYFKKWTYLWTCLLYTSPSPRDLSTSRMPSSA